MEFSHIATVTLKLLEAGYQEEALQILQASHFTIPVYSSLVYMSRTQHRGLNPECDRVQDLIQRVKDGDRQAIQEAAKVLATHPGLRGFKGWVAPAPRSKAGRPSNSVVAEALVHAGIGTEVVPMVQRIREVESSRMRRHRGEPGVSLEEHLESMGFVGVIADQGVLLVDDIFTTGTTLRASALTLLQAGYHAPLFGATLGYYQPDPTQARTCPVKHKTFYV